MIRQRVRIGKGLLGGAQERGIRSATPSVGQPCAISPVEPSCTLSICSLNPPIPVLFRVSEQI